MFNRLVLSKLKQFDVTFAKSWNVLTGLENNDATNDTEINLVSYSITVIKRQLKATNQYGSGSRS